MPFRVEPEALRTYAGQLADAKRAAEAAKSYVHKWGFSVPMKKACSA